MEASAILVLLVLPGVLAGPFQRQAVQDSCASRCPDSSKYRYEKGSGYEYQYEVETRTTMAGAAEDTATVTLTATAVIEVLDDCEMALRLKNVEVKRSHELNPKRMVLADDMSHARRALESQALRFAFYDGAVGELCPDDADDLWALNIKRGVLTAFQNSMRQLDSEEHIQEADVTGHCPTHFRVTQKGWKMLTVSKVKDMLSCQDRRGYRTSVLASTYHAPNSLQSVPLMKSSQECEYDVSQSEAVLHRSACQEVHVFRPFSRATSGAVTEVSQKLTFQTKSPGVSTRAGPVSRRTTLVFEHRQDLSSGDAAIADVKNKLKELCEISKDDIRPQVPQIFGELVHLMRNLDISDLRNLNSELQGSFCSDNAEKTRKFFLDALPMVGTANSLTMMKDLLLNEDIKDAQASFWLTSLAFLPDPTQEMIAAVQPLLTEPKTREDAMLAVSSLVNNYCHNRPGCSQEAEVGRVLDTLTAIIGDDCSVKNSNFDLVLLTLRAIGNIGQSEVVGLRLQLCFSQTSVPLDVRVAALDAFRRMPCSANRDAVMTAFLDQSEDSEVRIQAYLSVMKCPSDRVITQVREALQAEKVNQVGSFVWTHLTNLLETDSPHKQAIRDVLENELLQQEFRKDLRKYSRNYELSFFSDKFNLGGVYENNLIWSSDSFIPRSAMVNLTVDMFGHSVNLLEMGGRVQGLQYLLDNYFGPSSKEEGNEGGYGRSDIIKNEKMVTTKKKYGQVKEDLRAQMYLRVFGNELSYNSLGGSDVRKLRDGRAKAFFDDVFKKLTKNGKVSFSQSAVFMDSTIVIPTVAGLPLNLTVNGSVSVEMQASQELNFKKINAKSKAFTVAGMLQPSGSVELSSLMSVDAFVTKVGLKMSSRLHSSTAVKGRVELARGQIFSVEIDTPREKLEVFDFQSKFYIVHDQHEKEQRMVMSDRREKESCTGKALADIVGMELCASLSFPNASSDPDAPYFPFTGPASIAVTLHKHDVHSGYRLLAKQIQTGSAVISQLALDTPGSKVDRAISLGYIANLKDKTIEADLLSPWKKMAAKMSMEQGKKEWKASGAVTMDKDQTYSVTAQLDKNIKGKKDLVAKLKPSLIVSSPDGDLLNLQGTFDYKENKQVKANMVLEMNKVLKKPVSLDYTLIIRGRPDKKRYKSNVKFASQFATIKSSSQALVGTFSGAKRSALLTVRSRTDYNLHLWPSIKRNLVNVGVKIHDRSTASLKKYGVSLNVDAKRTPEANLHMDGEVSYKKTLTELEMRLRHGHNAKKRNDKSKELLVAGFVAHNIKKAKAIVRFDLKAIYPDKDVEYQIKGKHEQNLQSIEDYLTVSYGKGKLIDSHLLLAQTKKKRSATLDLSYPAGKTYIARDIKVNIESIEKNPKHHLLSILVSPQKGNKNSVVFSLKRPTDSSAEISGEAQIQGRQPITLEMSGNYGLRNMRGEGQLTCEGKTYSMDYTSDIQTGEYAKITANFVHPEQRVEGVVEGGRDRSEGVKRARAEVMWDALGDPTQKAGFVLELADSMQGGGLNAGGKVEVFTPVEHYLHMKGELRLVHGPLRTLTTVETVLGDDRDIYSAHFLLEQPVTKNNFRTVAWLKTPHPHVQHIEVEAKHKFEDSSHLTTLLSGVYNKEYLNVGVSFDDESDLVTRSLKAEAHFESSMSGGKCARMSFSHRDANNHYTSGFEVKIGQDQYIANLETNFQKVHWQITTDGTITFKGPQLTSPARLEWQHKNSLHELNSALTLNQEGEQIRLEVGGTANIVSKVYDARALLTGPWADRGNDHTSEFTLHFEESGRSARRQLSATLKIADDSYVFDYDNKVTSGSVVSTVSLTMSKYPEYSFVYTQTVRHSVFPFVSSVELKVAQQSLINIDIEVKNPRENVYRTITRVVLYLEDSVENIAVKTKHEKNRKEQWMTTGELEYEVGKTVLFNSMLGMEGAKKKFNLNIDSPYEELRSIVFEYSHSGNPERQFEVTSSLAVAPHFDTVSSQLSWKNRDRFESTLEVNTPFEEMRKLKIDTHSFRQQDGKRHSSVALNYNRNQAYKLDSVYMFDFPQAMDLGFNLTTPTKELPSLKTEIGYKFTDDEVSGKFKLMGPVTNFEELSTDFGHRRGAKSLTTQINAHFPQRKVYAGRANIIWDNDIEGSLSVESDGHSELPMQLILSHRGHTWESFRTKAGFRMNGDRLECEVGYSVAEGFLFILATPDPDISYLKTTVFHQLTSDNFAGRYLVQYGEDSKPYELGITTTFSEGDIGFSTDLKTPHTEDFEFEIGFAGNKRMQVKLLGMYGSQNKINTLVKYTIRDELWDVGGEFEYLVKGSGRNIGLIFKREGPLDNLRCNVTAKYMGRYVSISTQYKDGKKTSGRTDVHTNFEDYTNLAASFEHSGDSSDFETDIYLKYRDDKETKGTINFQRNKWKRVTMTTTFNLPMEDYKNNKLTYKHTYRRNKFAAVAKLNLGSAQTVNGEIKFTDNSKLTVSFLGPVKDFESFTATGTFVEGDKRLDGDASVKLVSQRKPITASYEVRAGTWPIMVNIKAQTPFDGWKDVEFITTHDGGITQFTSRNTLKAEAIGSVTSETVWTYTSPYVFEGLWVLTSSIQGGENLKLALKNAHKKENEYSTHMIVGWELLKEITVDAVLQLGDRQPSSLKYISSMSLTTPFKEISQLSVSLDHSQSERQLRDTAIAKLNDRVYLDADFDYSVGDRRVGSLTFREPRPMEFMIGGDYNPKVAEGELRLNWDKRFPEMNIHLTADYADFSDNFGTDRTIKVWAMHPARTMGVEHMLKKAAKEFQSELLLTWDKAASQTLAYLVGWTDRSSRYSAAYDALVKVTVPQRSVQVDGIYSNTGRVQAAEGSILWDADWDKNMRLGLKGQLDNRGKTRKVQLGLDLPFVDKGYSITTETAVNSGKSLLNTRTEFSYSVDPRKLIVVTTSIDDLSYGSDISNYSMAFGVVHPMTDVNIQVTSHVGSSKVLSSMATKVVYLTSDGQEKSVELRSRIDRRRRLMDIQLDTPVKTMSLEAQVSGDLNSNIQLTAIEDGKRSQFADIFINRETRTVEMTFRYDKASPGKSLNLFGHLINDNTLQTDVYRMDNGQRVSEMLMTVHLNSSHVMHTRLNWRPSMLTDLQIFLGGQLSAFSHRSGATFRALAEPVGHEVQSKYFAIMTEFVDEVAPLFKQLQEEMNRLRIHLNSMQRDMRRMYARNALHVRDMADMAQGALQSVMNGMASLTMDYEKAYAEVQKGLLELVKGLEQYPIARRYAQLIQELASGAQNSRYVLEQALDELLRQLGEFYDRSYRRYLTVSRQIERKLYGYTAVLSETPQYKKLAQAYSNARLRLVQLSQGDYRQLAEAANQRLLSALDRLGLKESYVQLVQSTKQLVGDQFHDLMQRPEFQQVYIITKEIYQQGVWAYQYWHVEKNMRLAAGQLLELAKDVTLLEITRIKNAVVDLDKSRVIVFDPTSGELQFEIYLPVSLKSLAEPPDLRVTKYVNRIKSWVATYVPSPRHSLLTSIHNYLPNMDVNTWLPPYTGYAYVVSDQHMVTFDGRHYNFAGRCSYILARDMLDDRFTVVIDYSNRPRHPKVESILVMLRGVSIEIARDNKIRVNNQETELPFLSGDISATRDRSIIRIRDGSYLAVEVDNDRGIYSVKLSGWYHGRTAGLLGTYDNEGSNDLTDSSRQMTTDLEAFANSWEAGKRYCRSRNLAARGPLDGALEEVHSCTQHLNHSASYYLPCFGQVEAGELVRVCVEYIRSGLSVQEAQCKAGEQYRYMCQRRGINLGTPAKCVSCLFANNHTVPGGHVEEVTSVEHGVTASADVVFIVEESDCNNWAQRSLASLATKFGQALTKNGLTANRFGLISFSGNGTHEPLVHTVDGEVFGDPGKFLRATENLRLSYPGGAASVEDVIREAVKYPFRVGVAKLLVLLPCSQCAVDLVGLNQVLMSNGFVLHVLKPHDFKVKESANLSPVRVFGRDRSQVYTRRSAARKGEDIFRELEVPTEACTLLAMFSNGSVFDSRHMAERGRIQQEFLESFATSGAKSAAPPSCQVCSCHDDGLGQGHTVCRLCDNNSWLWNHIPSWLQSSSNNVVGIFNDLHHQIITSLDVPSSTVTATE